MRRIPTPTAARLTITPLIDVAFLVIIFFMALPLKRLAFKLPSHLPEGVGLRESEVEPEYPVHIRVYKSGGRTAYMLGDRRTERVNSLKPMFLYLGPNSPYEIDADPEVEWQDVLDVIDLLKEANCKRVRFRGDRKLSKEILRATRLPRPAR
jgi:biopolymer transport protein ExbD